MAKTKCPEYLSELEYGKIYIIGRKAASDETLESYRRFLNGYYTRNFRIENMVSAKAPSQGALAARCINLGSIGQYGIIYNEINQGDEYEFNRLLSHLTDTSQMTFKPITDISVEVEESEDGNQRTVRSIYGGGKFKAAMEMAMIDAVDDEKPNEEEITLAEQESRREEILGNIRSLILLETTATGAMPVQKLGEMTNGKLLISSDKPSRLTVTDKLEIILPDYDNLEIPMSPLNKSLYLLFLRHGKGIKLNNIGNYQDELANLYNKIVPNKEQKLVDDAIKRMLDPADDNISDMLVKIRRCFLARILDEKSASPYFIAGREGCAWKAALPQVMITLPDFGF